MHINRIAVGLALAGCLAAPALARRHWINGTVTQTTPTGVYIRTSNGVTFVPSGSANFQLGNRIVTAPVVGQPYQVYYGNTWQPNYVPYEYYTPHQDWNWGDFRNSWQHDRSRWYQDRRGNWHRRR